MEIRFYFFSLTDFHLILRLFQHLTELTFSTLTNDVNFISPLLWHEFISTYLLELKQLQFYVEIIGKLCTRNILQIEIYKVLEFFLNSSYIFLMIL
jgi:hypothetical protein